MIVNTDNLYHFIYGECTTPIDCLESGNFKILPISKSPVVKYLMGDTNEYLNQSKIFLVREESLKYHLNLFENQKIHFEIKVIKFGNKYVVCDGMHRSSVLYYKDIRKIDIKVVSISTEPILANFEPYIRDEYFQN
jgi:hypothetical protein